MGVWDWLYRQVISQSHIPIFPHSHNSTASPAAPVARRTNDAPTRESRPRVRTPFIRRPPAPGPLAALHTCIHRLSKSRAHSPNADRPTRRPSRRWGDHSLPSRVGVYPLLRAHAHLLPAPCCPSDPLPTCQSRCREEPARLGTPLPGGRGPQMPGRRHWQRRGTTSRASLSHPASFLLAPDLRSEGQENKKSRLRGLAGEQVLRHSGRTACRPVRLASDLDLRDATPGQAGNSLVNGPDLRNREFLGGRADGRTGGPKVPESTPHPEGRTARRQDPSIASLPRDEEPPCCAGPRSPFTVRRDRATKSRGSPLGFPVPRSPSSCMLRRALPTPGSRRRPFA